MRNHVLPQARECAVFPTARVPNTVVCRPRRLRVSTKASSSLVVYEEVRGPGIGSADAEGKGAGDVASRDNASIAADAAGPQQSLARSPCDELLARIVGVEALPQTCGALFPFAVRGMQPAVLSEYRAESGLPVWRVQSAVSAAVVVRLLSVVRLVAGRALAGADKQPLDCAMDGGNT